MAAITQSNAKMVEAIKETAYTAFRASLMRRDALFIDNIWLLPVIRDCALFSGPLENGAQSLITFKDHKHLHDGTMVQCSMPDMSDVVDEVIKYI